MDRPVARGCYRLSILMPYKEWKRRLRQRWFILDQKWKMRRYQRVTEVHLLNCEQLDLSGVREVINVRIASAVPVICRNYEPLLKTSLFSTRSGKPLHFFFFMFKDISVYFLGKMKLPDTYTHSHTIRSNHFLQLGPLWKYLLWQYPLLGDFKMCQGLLLLHMNSETSS